ncbi:hypothetical protein Tco_0283337, partial [Tanacetum coccineum]
MDQTCDTGYQFGPDYEMLKTLDGSQKHFDRFNTSAGNPVKKILLKLNLPDHTSILTDSKVTPTKPGRITKPDSSPNFIANCFIADSLKDGHG